MSERLLDPSVLASIGRLDLIARTVVEGFLIGLHSSPYRGLSQEFAEHRPYIAGDEMRRVDWRVFARTDRLYVKEFEEETNAPVRLLFDVSGSLNFAPRSPGKLDFARYLLASLAYVAIRQHDRVELVCFSDEVRERVPSGGGQRNLHSILAALDRVEANGQTRISFNVLSEAASWKRRGLAVLVSDLYDEPDEVVEAVTRMRRVGHDVIVFHLMDRAERLLDQNGTFEFRDLETGELMVADVGRVRRAYVKRISEVREFYSREFARSGSDYAELDPAEPLDKALSIYLRRRKSSLRRV